MCEVAIVPRASRSFRSDHRSPTAIISFRRARGGGLAMIIIPRAPFFVHYDYHPSSADEHAQRARPSRLRQTRRASQHHVARNPPNRTIALRREHHIAVHHIAPSQPPPHSRRIVTLHHAKTPSQPRASITQTRTQRAASRTGRSPNPYRVRVPSVRASSVLAIPSTVCVLWSSWTITKSYRTRNARTREVQTELSLISPHPQLTITLRHATTPSQPRARANHTNAHTTGSQSNWTNTESYRPLGVSECRASECRASECRSSGCRASGRRASERRASERRASERRVSGRREAGVTANGKWQTANGTWQMADGKRRQMTANDGK